MSLGGHSPQGVLRVVLWNNKLPCVTLFSFNMVCFSETQAAAAVLAALASLGVNLVEISLPFTLPLEQHMGVFQASGWQLWHYCCDSMRAMCLKASKVAMILHLGLVLLVISLHGVLEACWPCKCGPMHVLLSMKSSAANLSMTFLHRCHRDRKFLDTVQCLLRS